MRPRRYQCRVTGWQVTARTFDVIALTGWGWGYTPFHPSPARRQSWRPPLYRSLQRVLELTYRYERELVPLFVKLQRGR